MQERAGENVHRVALSCFAVWDQARMERLGADLAPLDSCDRQDLEQAEEEQEDGEEEGGQASPAPPRRHSVRTLEVRNNAHEFRAVRCPRALEQLPRTVLPSWRWRLRAVWQRAAPATEGAGCAHSASCHGAAPMLCIQVLPPHLSSCLVPAPISCTQPPRAFLETLMSGVASRARHLSILTEQATMLALLDLAKGTPQAPCTLQEVRGQELCSCSQQKAKPGQCGAHARACACVVTLTPQVRTGFARAHCLRTSGHRNVPSGLARVFVGLFTDAGPACSLTGVVPLCGCAASRRCLWTCSRTPC